MLSDWWEDCEYDRDMWEESNMEKYAGITLLTLAFNRNNTIKLNTVPDSKLMTGTVLHTIGY